MKNTSKSYGYCHITLEAQTPRKLLRSNNERAFIISQLQDLLSPRLILGDVPAYRQLASCIDLLAFSISSSSIHFLVFTIDMAIAADFSHRISARLDQYQSELGDTHLRHASEIHTSLEVLSGPHEALDHSVAIHLLHEDWEYDRYSSIGFYLHDRRGDWMRYWRLAVLYDNEPQFYRQLLEGRNTKASPAVSLTTAPQFLAS